MSHMILRQKYQTLINNFIVTWGNFGGILQEEKLEDDSFPVNVPAELSEYRLDTVSGSNSIPISQLHLLITAR